MLVRMPSFRNGKLWRSPDRLILMWYRNDRNARAKGSFSNGPKLCLVAKRFRSDESPDIIPETLYHKIQKDFGRQSTDEQVGMLLLLNSKGINIALKQLEINHCAHILGKISQYFEYRMIFANSLYRIGEGKRLEILDIWKKADSVLYNRAITCLKLRESHILKNNELPTHIPNFHANFRKQQGNVNSVVRDI
ncbi:hypothetical protein MPH_13360 [Macrophomina phaseolina MS6]|uniref:Uncharacterized protein n=1 Tax=Macrophomina phaseolina (strain MS6) TaxID=1126212 RepID=K2R603_MACPH|nr:hypothetical protein MPH_13360 [Macrophomina phaseolina MS6]